MIISEFELRLSAVPRWVIVNTIQKQSVAEHSFNVAIIAPRIAINHFGVSQRDFETLYRITRYALLHDQYEAFTGDIPSPAKAALGIKENPSEFDTRVNEYEPASELIERVVKVADYIDAILFLSREMEMGNGSVRLIHMALYNRLASLMCDNYDMTLQWYDIDRYLQMTHQQDPLEQFI